MNIYIATPVNGRPEPTLEEKRQKAHNRICNIRKQLHRNFPNAEFHSSFDDAISPINKNYYEHFMTESDIMGKCVALVMKCDMIVLDYGWNKSRGCRLEKVTAEIYDVYIAHAAILGVGKEQGYDTDRGCLSNYPETNYDELI